MNERDKQRIIARYNARMDRYGPTIQTLASGTEERRQIRYRVLAEVGIDSTDSVLDVGCGFGDLLGFLTKRVLNVDYTGYDINPKLVAEARRRYPDHRFEVKDVCTEEYPKFDFIVSTSAFNLKLKYEDNYEYVERLLRSCYEHARKGVAVDFLSSYAGYYGKDAFHYQPEKLFEIGKKITKRVCLRHDYPLFEFCVYLYRDFQGWNEHGCLHNIRC